MANPIRTKFTVLLTGLASLALGIVFASALDWTPASNATQDDPSISAPTTQASLRATGNAFIQIAQDVTPSVVSVRADRRVSTASMRRFDFGPFDDFFDQPQREGDEQEEFFRQPSGGSGVIVREDGYVLTNNHVVNEAESVGVVLNDGRSFDAQIVGVDPSTDLAVLKIEAEDLKAARIAQDDAVQVGQWVVAFGNPFGLNFTMTAGIVSAVGRGSLGIIGRSNANPYAIENFIQTDAAINPGNSGGPLVDIDGEVIGINTAIASRSGGYQGYGFAIPISIVREVMNQLIETGEVRRAILGISIQSVTPLDQEALGLPSVKGVLIADFDGNVADNPAQKAGLQPGDVVLAVDGKPVNTPSDLQTSIAFHKPGESVEITIWRDRKERKIDVVLGERPKLETLANTSAGDEESIESALGIEVQDISSQVRAALAERTDVDIEEIPDGVFVRDVEPFSAADEAGIPTRAIITQIGDIEVKNVADYRRAVEELEPGSVVYLKIYLPGGTSQLLRAIRVPR